jgi:hypothetical protein
MQLKPPETEPTERPAESTAIEDARLEGQSETAESPPLDVVFDLLSNERRRRVLRHLLSETETSTLGDLAEHIAAIENEKPESALTSTERKRVYICLYQCHLPKLDDADVIDFDEHRKTVSLGSQIDAIRPYLPGDEPTDTTDPWPRYYLGVALLGACAIAVQALLVQSAWISGAVIGVLLTVVSLAALDQLRRSGHVPSGGRLSTVLEARSSKAR